MLKSSLVALPLVILAGAGLVGRPRQTVSAPQAPKPPRHEPVPSRWTADKVAGSYYFGDGLGQNCSLKLSKSKRFQFQWRGCLGVYDRNEGPYHFDGDLLVLEPTQPNVRGGLSGTATLLYPVRWGKRLYLISKEEMVSFCSAVASGWDGAQSEGLNGNHYVRLDVSESDLLKPAGGFPQVPASFRHLLQTRFHATVTALEDGEIMIDRGANDGICIGSQFYPIGQAMHWIIVDKVEASSARAHMVPPTAPLPQEGDVLYAFSLDAVGSQDQAAWQKRLDEDLAKSRRSG